MKKLIKKLRKLKKDISIIFNVFVDFLKKHKDKIIGYSSLAGVGLIILSVFIFIGVVGIFKMIIVTIGLVIIISTIAGLLGEASKRLNLGWFDDDEV